MKIRYFDDASNAISFWSRKMRPSRSMVTLTALLHVRNDGVSGQRHFQEISENGQARR
ncbi:MAG: hypothetical protein IPN63_10090 [Gammaproteobacteria bacterium]|nr:hypothetical protein [Gammaproteobacteria bacterium]MBK9427708.1 hypothetical protein [Gammaproteobacteria bacterium]